MNINVGTAAAVQWADNNFAITHMHHRKNGRLYDLQITNNGTA